MKKGFRIISLFVILLFALQSFTTFAVSEDTDEHILYQKSDNIDNTETILVKLGIVSDNGNETDKITKGAYIQYILNMMKITPAPAEEQLFFDVPLTSSYADAINTAYISGLITGGTDGNAGAEKPITLGESIIISVRALNADGMITPNDKSYFAYMQTAVKLGLYDGITLSPNEEITRKDAMRVLFNTVNSTFMTTINGVDYEMTEKTLLESLYHVYRAKGIVESCSYGNIYGGASEHNSYVTVDGTRYTYDDMSSRNLLGQNVIVYYIKDMNNEVNEILYMYSHGNDILEMQIKNVLSHKYGVITYNAGTQKDYRVSLSNSALTLLNGERISVGTTDFLLPVNGNVKIIDNNSDGDYDVILYNEYVTELAVSVNQTDKIVYSEKGKFSKIDLSEYDVYHIYDKNGNETDISAISKDSVLSICAKTDMSFIEIIVCTDTVEFTALEVCEESYNKGRYYRIKDTDGDVYDTVAGFSDISENNSIIENVSGASGKKYKVALSADGEIAAILSWTVVGNFEYGYIINKKEPAGIKDGEIQMLTESSGVKIYSVAQKVRVTYVVNDESIAVTCSASEYVRDYAKVGVTKYKLDEKGKINAVYIVQEFDDATVTEDERPTTGFRQDITIDSKNSYQSRYDSDYCMLGGRIVVNENTKVFFLPDEIHLGDIQWYSAGTGMSLVGQEYYTDAVSYKYDDDVYADVLVIPSKNLISKTSAIMLVEDLIMIYDIKTNTEHQALSGFVNGISMTYPFEDNKLNLYTGDSNYIPEKGDVIRYSINLQGYLSNIEPILDYNDGSGNCKLYNFSSSKQYAFGDGACQVFGKMNDIYEGVFMNVTDVFDKKQKQYFYPITSRTMFFEYDANSRRKNIKTITADDITTLKADPYTETRVLIITRDSAVPLVVVYK